MISCDDAYNLYNEETVIIDYRPIEEYTKYSINYSFHHSDPDFLDYIDNFSKCLIIGPIESKTDIKFKTIYHFDNTISLYKKFPIIFDKNFKRTFPSFVPYFSNKRIFVGSISSLLTGNTVDKDIVEYLQITSIINLTSKSYRTEINEHHFPCDDSESEDIIDILKKTCEILTFSDNICIVCNKGRSRSVSVLLHYYMTYTNTCDIELALSNLKKCRSICAPNSGFLKQIEFLHT